MSNWSRDRSGIYTLRPAALAVEVHHALSPELHRKNARELAGTSAELACARWSIITNFGPFVVESCAVSGLPDGARYDRIFAMTESPVWDYDRILALRYIVVPAVHHSTNKQQARLNQASNQAEEPTSPASEEYAEMERMIQRGLGTVLEGW